MLSGTRAVAALFALSLALPSLARAEDRPLADAVIVSTPDECVDAPALVQQVATWLRRDGVDAAFGVVVDVQGTAASFHITRDGQPVASRSFDELPADCADRRAALGLAIALGLDAAVLDSLGVPSPDEEPPPDEPPAPRPPRGERLAVALEAEALLALEVLPEPALAGAVSVAVATGEGVRLRAGALATQEVGTSLGRGGADLALVAGRADVCFGRTLESVISLGGCGGALAGALLAAGRDLPTVRSEEIAWVALAARAEARWMPADPLAISLAVDALFPVLRPRLEVGDGSGGVLAARDLPAAGVAIVIGAALVID